MSSCESSALLAFQVWIVFLLLSLTPLRASFALPLPEENEDVVEAVGVAEIANEDVSGAREVALVAAFRAAVRSLIETRLQPSLFLGKEELLRQTVDSDSGHFIERYQVLSQERLGKEWSVRIRAAVSWKNLMATLHSKGFLSAGEETQKRILLEVRGIRSFVDMQSWKSWLQTEAGVTEAREYILSPDGVSFRLLSSGGVALLCRKFLEKEGVELTSLDDEKGEVILKWSPQPIISSETQPFVKF